MQFFLIINVITAAFIAAFFYLAPATSDNLVLLYRLSSFGYYACILGAIWLLVSLSSKIIRPVRFLIPLIAALWLVFLIADLIVFRIYSFHINMLLLGMLVFDFAGMGLPWFAILLMVILPIVLLLSSFYLWRKLGKTFKFFDAALFALLAILALAFNSVISIWSQEFSRSEYTVFNQYLPWYFPVQSGRDAHKLAAHFPDVFPAVYGAKTSQKITGVVAYPKASLQCSRTPKNNIIMIVVESLQADALSTAIMPNSMQFAVDNHATIFKQHLSAGSVTLTGVFSLLSGLHASYYQLFKDSGTESVFAKTLAAHNYAINIFSQSDLHRYQLKQLVLPQVAASNYLKVQNDAEALSKLKQKIAAQNSQQAFFDFIFFTSSHSDYSYPPQFSKFKPLPAVKGGYMFDSFADNTPYKNDYHNSVYYVDHLIGETLAAYKARGLLENAIVIITGDHAEEFNESGMGWWGHGSKFTKWQVQVPLILKLVNQAQPQVVDKRSLHQDVVPTILKYGLGCSNKFSDYSSGTDLLAISEERDTVLSSYFDDAYLIGNDIYEKVALRNYNFNTGKPISNKMPAAAYLKLLDEQRHFLK